METQTLTQEQLEIIEFKKREYEKIEKNLDKLLTAKFLERELEELKKKHLAVWEKKSWKYKALEDFERAGRELANKIAWILGEYQNYLEIPFFKIKHRLRALYDIYSFGTSLSLEQIHRWLKVALVDLKCWGELENPTLD